MKKQYISPEATVVVVDTQNDLMSGSFSTTMKTDPVDDDTEDFIQYSRRNNFWDDDEE